MTIKTFLKSIGYHKWVHIHGVKIHAHCDGDYPIELGVVYFSLLYGVRDSVGSDRGGFLEAVKYNDWKGKVTSIIATWPGQIVPLHLGINPFEELAMSSNLATKITKLVNMGLINHEDAYILANLTQKEQLMSNIYLDCQMKCAVCSEIVGRIHLRDGDEIYHPNCWRG